MDLSTDCQAEAAHIIHHTVLDQISETIAATQATMKATTIDKPTTETTIETEDTNRTHGMIKEIIAFRTGMTTTKTGMGLTTEDDQLNTDTTEINPEHR